jgi:predicted permease
VALIVPGFFALGVFLMAEREDGTLPFPPPLTAAVGVAVVLRLLVAPALVAAASALIVTLPDAYLLAAAMPTGINSLVVAHAYGLDLRLIASAIAWSTAIVVAAASLATVL